MGLFNLFQKPVRIGDRGALDAFLAEQTAFLDQKTTWEYSRARSGVLWQKLFKEEAFKAAIDASTWRNYPLCLAFVGEMTAATLRVSGDVEPDLAVSGVAEACRRVIKTHPLPTGFEPEFWDDAATFVTERLNRTLVAPPKAVKDIPLDGHRTFFDRLPMHPDLTKHDGLLLQNTLRINLCRAHEILLARMNPAALAQVFASEAESKAA
jgi:hypothetical protein